MKDLIMLGGSIRYLNASSWATIDDAGHTPIGIGGVQIVASDRVRVSYTQEAEKVVTFSVTVDEAFAAAGVRCGASVGLTYADIFFYMGTSQTPVNPGLLSRAGANVWLHGLFMPRIPNDPECALSPSP